MKGIIFIFLLFTGHLFAQTEEIGLISKSTIGDIGIPSEGNYYLPAYQQISIYSLPNAKSKVFCKTNSFKDSLKVVEVTKKNSIYKNVYGFWCKVTFPLKGRRYIGYVPSQFLGSLYITNSENRYVLLVEKFVDHKFLLTLKILHNFNLVSTYSFLSPANDGYSPNEKDDAKQAMSGFMELALFNNKGLDSINNILKLSKGVEACGYWYGQKYLLLKNNNVVYELEDGSIADADIYHKGYEYIFPIDSLGEQQKLLKNIGIMN